MVFMIIGIFALIIGVLISMKTYNWIEAGAIVAIMGILFIILGALSPQKEVKAESFAEPMEVQAEELSVVPRQYHVDDLVYRAYEDVTEDDIDLLARLITAEMGYSTSYDPMDYEHLAYLCGSVVINRMESDKFPDTLEEVIYQAGQYACVDDGHIERDYDDVAWEIAEELLTYGTTIDPDVVFQSEFPQGSGIYQRFGNQYFCFI